MLVLLCRLILDIDAGLELRNPASPKDFWSLDRQGFGCLVRRTEARSQAQNKHLLLRAAGSQILIAGIHLTSRSNQTPSSSDQGQYVRQWPEN